MTGHLTVRPPPLLLRVLVLAALVVPQVVALVVQGVAPLLLRDAPLVLLALHPYEPWSLLVAARTDPGSFLGVVVGVRVVLCSADFFVGRWYGSDAVDRLSRGRRTGRATAVVVRLSRKAGWAVLLLYPGATASVLAGAAGMSLRRFFPLMATGIVLAAVLTRVLAASASGPLREVASLSDRSVVPGGLALLLLALLAVLVPWLLRGGRGSRR